MLLGATPENPLAVPRWKKVAAVFVRPRCCSEVSRGGKPRRKLSTGMHFTILGLFLQDYRYKQTGARSQCTPTPSEHARADRKKREAGERVSGRAGVLARNFSSDFAPDTRESLPVERFAN